MKGYIIPNWPAPTAVRAFSTTREVGFSKPPYECFNLSDRVGDDPETVCANRSKLHQDIHLPSTPAWLHQLHSTLVIPAEDALNVNNEADATYTQIPGIVCVTQTADCLPVLLCDRIGHRVAAIHAGWKGLSAGIIEATITAMEPGKDELIAWLGPAIGPDAFIVDADVRDAFLKADPRAKSAIKEIDKNKWSINLNAIAQQRLNRMGIGAIYGGEYCTYRDKNLFYSFRRDGEKTGRMATLIWLISPQV